MQYYTIGDKKVLYCADLFLSNPPIPYLKWEPEAVMKILKKVFGNVDTIYREHHPILGEYWYVKSNKESE